MCKMPDVDVEKTCMNIKRLCTVKGVSPVDIQNALALESVQAVYKWSAGKSVPSLANLIKIAYLLEMDLDDIVETKKPADNE